MSDNEIKKVTEAEALAMHAGGRPGKLAIQATKPLTTQHDLSLAYSPGVAYPCLKIAENPDTAFDYTARGNMVAVISNGTAVLGLGNLGALASKPVMEGKAVLFKRFADVDSIDLEVDTQDVDAFVNAVRYLGPSFGGINLEDIKAPECFIIEQRLRELMDIPVFHDDQHGTAIIVTAGFINALHLTRRDIGKVKLVVNGAGASAIACVELLKTLGLPHGNVTLCDKQGVIYQGRTEGMDQWKSAHAVQTKARTLTEALDGADMFLGLSAANCVTKEMVKKMAKKPIIFALANPDPEIAPEEARAAREDAIIATGRSDYPNQVNNVLGFPYIFRGALDVRARTINDTMKLAAARALAELAREDVPDEVDAAYGGRRLRFGPEYIIPVPFDPRLIEAIPLAVARAAMESGVARRPLTDEDSYRQALRARLDPTSDRLEMIFEQVRKNPRRVVFAEGEEETAIRAALSFREAGYGTPLLVGRSDVIATKLAALGLEDEAKDLEIHNARLSTHSAEYVDYLYTRHQRQGMLKRDCQRMANQNRNVFAALMVQHGQADAMVTGLTRGFPVCFGDIRKVLDQNSHSGAFGLTLALAHGRTVFIADTAVHVEPDAERLAAIAQESAGMARRFGQEPRVAFLSYASFQKPGRERQLVTRQAAALLSERDVDFEFDGEMTAEAALDYELQKRLYPFTRLTGPANVLIMPDLLAAHISAKLVQALGAAPVLGPLLVGMKKPVQMVRLNATVSEVVTAAVLAAQDAGQAKRD